MNDVKEINIYIACVCCSVTRANQLNDNLKMIFENRPFSTQFFATFHVFIVTHFLFYLFLLHSVSVCANILKFLANDFSYEITNLKEKKTMHFLKTSAFCRYMSLRAGGIFIGSLSFLFAISNIKTHSQAGDILSYPTSCGRYSKLKLCDTFYLNV